MKLWTVLSTRESCLANNKSHQKSHSDAGDGHWIHLRRNEHGEHDATNCEPYNQSMWLDRCARNRLTNNEKQIENEFFLEKKQRRLERSWRSVKKESGVPKSGKAILANKKWIVKEQSEHWQVQCKNRRSVLIEVLTISFVSAAVISTKVPTVP